MATIETLLSTWLCATKIGADQYGNHYYISKTKNHDGQYKRSVLYKGLAEASKVPPLWHSWLHYTTDKIPESSSDYKWQQPYKPNLTGTQHAYKQPSLSGNKTYKVKKSYLAWEPNQE
jgi:NADH:ubiquinone oxidoreductase subunit